MAVDWSPVAVEAARRRAADFLPEGRARFVVGELADSGLPSGQAAAVVCLDAVAFAPDRVAALREVRRLLRPDGRYVFSATEVGSPPDRSWVTDWQPLLAAADLQTESKDEVPHYAERLQRMYDLWLENLGALDRVLKLFGIAMATAVFLDAIVIRTVLLPAVLELLGRRTWALPHWFDRRLPQLAIEPAPAAEPPPLLEKAA